MRAAVLAAAVLVATVPAAEAKKRRAFAPKRAATACAAKRAPCTRGWQARPKNVMPATAPQEEAPAELAGAPAERFQEAAPPPPAPTPAGTTTTTAPACDPSPWIGVTAEDVGGFRLRLTRTCVPGGTVLFQFRNRDLAEHNLWAEGVEPLAAPREIVAGAEGETTVEASASLTAGRWRLYCSFEGHEAMSRLVDVTP